MQRAHAPQVAAQDRLSWRKSRHVPYRTASKTVQMEFKEKAGGQARFMCRQCAVFTEDEAAVQMQQNPKYGCFQRDPSG